MDYEFIITELILIAAIIVVVLEVRRLSKLDDK
jgi:Sec-independent protein translocase protein TatA